MQFLDSLRRARGALIAVTLATFAGCAPSEPPSWPQGGAHIVIAPASWDRQGDDKVELKANGEIVEDGDLVFLIDRVGRVVDADYEPYAILLPDGQLRGTRNELLGRIGVSNAAPPWGPNAWLSVLPDGIVVRYDENDGAREPLGQFHGCSGPALRTCTLVTHLMQLRKTRRATPYRPYSPYSPYDPFYGPMPMRFGLGIGIGL